LCRPTIRSPLSLVERHVASVASVAVEVVDASIGGAGSGDERSSLALVSARA
jgi:hypothetical protein